MGVIGFFSFTLMSVFLLSSCGLAGGGSGFFDQSSELDGGPGDGDTPRLASRLQDDPDIADKDCEDSDTCEETCRYIYKESDSYKNCDELTIKQVVRLEVVFHTLFEADYDEGRGGDLEDIEEDDLRDYLEIGLDGWRDKVVSKQKMDEDDRDEKFENTLHWIVDDENKVVPVLQAEDRNDEILKEIFLGHCGGLGADNECDNGGAFSGGTFSFDYTAGDLSHSGTVIASIDDRENKELFLALVAGGTAFFEKAADGRRFEAFVLGNNLVEQACTSRSDRSVNQCIAAFYCYLGEQTYNDNASRINQDFLRQSEIVEGVGREIDLYGCGTVTSF